MSTALTVSFDAANAHCPGKADGVGHPRLILATCILASSLAFVDSSVVNVALPTLGKSLHAEADDLQWIVNAYLLPLSALLLLGGAAGDRYGRRGLLIGGIGLFGLASAVCAMAPSLGWMLAGRFAQGVGAAILMPNSLAILGQTFTGAARGRAIGIWAATGAVTGAIGPVLGGWFVDLGAWRAIFLINLPLAAAAIGLAWFFVPVAAPRQNQPPPLDAAGALLAALGLFLLTVGLTLGSGPRGWSLLAAGACASGAVILIAFIFVEKHRGKAAMMPLTLFGSATFVGLTLLTLLLYAALGGLLVLLPYTLIKAGGYSGTAAGAALLPLPLILSVLSPVVGGLAARTGTRNLLVAGPVIVGLGFLLAMRIGTSQDYFSAVLPAIVVIALGLVCAVAPLTTAVLGSVDGEHTGAASGLNSAVARTGGLMATALIGSVLAARGPALLSAFQFAAAVGAATCAAAALGAWALLAK